jgi:hypothetical protein
MKKRWVLFVCAILVLLIGCGPVAQTEPLVASLEEDTTFKTEIKAVKQGTELTISPSTNSVIYEKVRIALTKVPEGTQSVAFSIQGPEIQDMDQTGPNLGFDNDASDGWGIEMNTLAYANSQYEIVAQTWDAIIKPGQKLFPTSNVKTIVQIKNSKGFNFARNYPMVIKGNWEPNENFMKQVLDDSDRLKGLGVNTVSISVDYELNKDGSYFMRSERQIMLNLFRAKENNFAVLLTPNFIGPNGHNWKEEGVDITKERFLQISEEVMLKWAKIAEEYNVEFFGPQKEFNFILARNWDDSVKISNTWHKEMLPKLKKVYQGKLIVLLGRAELGIDVSGYDYLGITVGPGNTVNRQTQSLPKYREELHDHYQLTNDIAKAAKVEWLVTEGMAIYGGVHYPDMVLNDVGESLDDMQDDYYKVMFEEYLKFKPAGFIFWAWLMPGADIKDRPAEVEVKKFFAKI